MPYTVLSGNAKHTSFNYIADVLPVYQFVSELIDGTKSMQIKRKYFIYSDHFIIRFVCDSQITVLKWQTFLKPHNEFIRYGHWPIVITRQIHW